jgi:hypothetical protein
MLIDKLKIYFILIIILSFVFNIIYYRSSATAGTMAKNNISWKLILLFSIILILFSYDKFYITLFDKNLKNDSEDILVINTVNRILKNINDYTNDLNIPDVYPINKIPKKFLFIKNNNFIKKIIFDLKFLESFNKDSYYKIIILLEYFFKYYYKTITGEYEYTKVIEMLISIRKTILNLLTEQIFSIPINLNLPNTRYDIKISDNYINNIVQKVQAYTHSKLKILSNKNRAISNKYLNHYKLPREHNLFKNKYEIF